MSDAAVLNTELGIFRPKLRAELRMVFLLFAPFSKHSGVQRFSSMYSSLKQQHTQHRSSELFFTTQGTALKDKGWNTCRFSHQKWSVQIGLCLHLPTSPWCSSLQLPNERNPVGDKVGQLCVDFGFRQSWGVGCLWIFSSARPIWANHFTTNGVYWLINLLHRRSCTRSCLGLYSFRSVSAWRSADIEEDVLRRDCMRMNIRILSCSHSCKVSFWLPLQTRFRTMASPEDACTPSSRATNKELLASKDRCLSFDTFQCQWRVCRC